MLPEHLTLTHTFMYIYMERDMRIGFMAGSELSLAFIRFFLIKLMSSVYCLDRFIGLF